MLSAGGSVVLSDKFSVEPVLARHRALRLHAVPIYRRALPLSVEGAAIRIRKPAPAAARLRQRVARRYLGSVSGALCHSADPRILCGDRRQFLAVTMSRASRARSAGFRRCWRIAFRPRSCGSMPKLAFPFATKTVSAFACARGEVGEAIGRIGTADEGGGRFEGYTDAAETEKKILRDVFAKGDAWFRTGDLMRLDEQGYFHFVDRVGDTFRWKGENVATVRGERGGAGLPRRRSTPRPMAWKFPGADGRAGMAAIVVGRWFRSRSVRRTSVAAACRPMRFRCSSGSAQRSMPPKPSSRRNRSWSARVLIRAA